VGTVLTTVQESAAERVALTAGAGVAGRVEVEAGFAALDGEAAGCPAPEQAERNRLTVAAIRMSFRIQNLPYRVEYHWTGRLD
jgi:hypothetical protein